MKPIHTLIERALTGLDRTGLRIARVILNPTASAFEPCRVPAPVPVPARRPRPRWKVVAPVLALATAMLPGSAGAWHRDRVPDAMTGQLVEVRVRVEGEAAPLYVGPGDWSKRYVQAFKGRHYSLELRNLTDRRIGVAISVDGLSVLDGERTRLASNQSMYVLDPFERTEIRGWRTSLDHVRRFVFVDEERSYASRTDQANGDMGWIRVHAFREWQPVSIWGRDSYDYRAGRPGSESGDLLDRRERRDANEPKSEAREIAPAPGPQEGAQRMDAMRQAPQAEAFPGTGWGDQRRDPVRRVEFRAERDATDRLVFRYEYESGLRALGIELRRHRLWEREGGELGFAKPPRW